MRKSILILAAALAAAAGGVQAQQAWRCGNSYSGEPCPGGVAVSVTPAVTAQGAARQAKSDAQRADALEKARLAQEKAAPRAAVMGPAPVASAPVATKKPAKPTKAEKKAQVPSPFTAVGVAPKPKK